nr:MAG TPA: hypothetical protein [Caudoviricetes sp.]
MRLSYQKYPQKSQNYNNHNNPAFQNVINLYIKNKVITTITTITTISTQFIYFTPCNLNIKLTITPLPIQPLHHPETVFSDGHTQKRQTPSTKRL